MEPESGPHDLSCLETAGFTPVSRYVSAVADLRDTIGPEPVTMAGIDIEQWDGADAEQLIDDLYTMSLGAFSKNRFFKPISPEAFQALYRPLLPFIVPDHVLFARRGAKLVGFLFGSPNPLWSEGARSCILKTYATTQPDITDGHWERMLSGDGLLAGKQVPAVDVRIEDDEILITGDHVNKTYLDPSGDSDNKRLNGDTIWHRTGDAGRTDNKGRLWLRGRHGSQAGRLYPFEIETAARLWPGVRNVALVANSNPPLLAIEGDANHLDAWRERASFIGEVEICSVGSIPPRPAPPFQSRPEETGTADRLRAALRAKNI